MANFGYGRSVISHERKWQTFNHVRMCSIIYNTIPLFLSSLRVDPGRSHHIHRFWGKVLVEGDLQFDYGQT